MNNDTELFELCREVYQKTGWETPVEQRWNDGESIETDTPSYDSDYLLEKLHLMPTKEPEIQEEPCIVLEHSGVVKPEYKWAAKAFDGDWTKVHSTTPLKALLKLVIALDEAGVEL